jgi:uncharacterized protein YjbI with pentapeptide repeats
VDSSLVGYGDGYDVRYEEIRVAAETGPLQQKPQWEEQARRVPRWLAVLAVLALAGVVVGVILYGYLERPGWIGVADKRFWDYLDLLIVPAALALGVYWLNRVQSERELKAEQAQQESALRVEDQRAQSEALQAYLDAMDRLLRDVSLTESSDQLTFINRELAQARTTTVIATLGPERNRIVTLFLRNLRLTQSPISILREADLAAAKVAGAFLQGADLREADLRDAILSRAYLVDANLINADLEEANLIRAWLIKADLDRANLDGADLGRAHLSEANLSEVNMNEANLSKADLSNTQEWIDDQLRAA